MAPTAEEVLAAFNVLSGQNSNRIYSWPDMSKRIMRQLRTSTPYVNKCMRELGEQGLIKVLRVAPSGALYLEQDERNWTKYRVVYFHPDNSYSNDAGTVSLDYPSGTGNLWSGANERAYVLSLDCWEPMLERLTEEATERKAAEQKKRDADQEKAEAELVAHVPGYAEVREALGKLLPDADVRFEILTRDAGQPQILIRDRRLYLSDFQVLVDLIRKGLSAT